MSLLDLVLRVPEANPFAPGAHIVLMADILSPGDDLDRPVDQLVDQLSNFCAEVTPFWFTLADVARFPHGEPYLMVEPTPVFARLMSALQREFGTSQPRSELWVPHLAITTDAATELLPITAWADTATLIRHSDEGILEIASFAFGDAAA